MHTSLEMSAKVTETSATLSFENYMASLSDQQRKHNESTHRHQASPKYLKDIQAKTLPEISSNKFVHPYTANNDNPVMNSYHYTNFDSAFASMAHTAFAEHKAVTLRPDDIHLLIVQGVTNFLQQYPEDFRETLVDFEGKVNVNVLMDDINDPDAWEWMPKGFAGLIRQIIKTPATADLLLQDYSQTTEMDKTVKAITLMGTFSSYLNYTVHTLCHIPQFILQGTEEDWLKLRDMPQQLIAQLQLTAPKNNEKPNGMQLMHRWLSRLAPVLEKMYLGRTGNADPSFWDSFYKFNSSSGGDNVSGYIVYFYPFLKAGEGFNSQKVLNPFIMGEEVTLAKGSFHSGPTTDQLTANIVTVDFKLKHRDQTYDMGMQAGIVAHSDDPSAKDKSLHTHVDYALYYADKVPADAELVGKHVEKVAAEIRAKKRVIAEEASVVTDAKEDNAVSKAAAQPAAVKPKRTIHFELEIGGGEVPAAKEELKPHVPPVTAKNDVLYAMFRKGFFSQQADPASELLQYVILANWDKVDSIIKQNPELMLQQGKAVDVTTASISMSPLQYAYYVHDKHMQDVFEKHADKLKSIDDYQKQIVEQKSEFDLTPLMQTYEKCLKLLALYDVEYNEHYREDAVRSRIFKEMGEMTVRMLGGAQCNLMPRHMLKQMCASEDYRHQGLYDWAPNAEFNGPVPTPVSYVMEQYFDKVHQDQDPTELYETDFDELITKRFHRLGVDAALERGNDRLITKFDQMFHDKSIYEDMKTLEHLFEVRKDQQDERVARMLQAPVQQAVNHV